jgi:hypothetical protein
VCSQLKRLQQGVKKLLLACLKRETFAHTVLFIGMLGSLINVLTSPFRAKEEPQTPVQDNSSSATAAAEVTVPTLPVVPEPGTLQAARSVQGVAGEGQQQQQQQQQVQASQQSQYFYYGFNSPVSSKPSQASQGAFERSGLNRTPVLQPVQVQPVQQSRNSTNPFVGTAPLEVVPRNQSLPAVESVAALDVGTRPKRAAAKGTAEAGHFRNKAGLGKKK